MSSFVIECRLFLICGKKGRRFPGVIDGGSIAIDRGAPMESRARRGPFHRSIRAIGEWVFIAISWVIAIGSFYFPVVQIIVIVVTVIALMFGADNPPIRRNLRPVDEIQHVRKLDD